MQDGEQLILHVSEDEAGSSGSAAQSLIDWLRERDEILSVDRRKADQDTMDLGTIVHIVFTSGATLALAQGLAGWLKARRGASVTVEKNTAAGSIKTIVAGVDPATARRIVEQHLQPGT